MRRGRDWPQKTSKFETKTKGDLKPEKRTRWRMEETSKIDEIRGQVQGWPQKPRNSRPSTLSSLISMLHAYLFFGKFSYLHGLIRTYTLIDFRGKFLPTLLKRVGKIIFYLVPTRLLGPTRLLYFKKLSHLHCYSELTLIRDLRVILPKLGTHFQDWHTYFGLFIVIV